MGILNTKKPTQPPFFAWTNAEHSVGVARFDAEHKELAAAISRVHRTLQGNRDHILIQRLVEDLIAETSKHFLHEELAMETAGFEDRAGHVAEHEILIKSAWEIDRKFRNGLTSALALPILLKNWFIPHIQEWDRKYAATLRRHGID
jgi:hemerythrin